MSAAFFTDNDAALQRTQETLKPDFALAMSGPCTLSWPQLVRELAEERTRRERAEESERAMRQALAFDAATVQEGHHRVKNTLQVAAGVLSLHSRATKCAEVRTALEESRRRLHLLANVHQLLSGCVGHAREIPMHKLLRVVGAALRESFGDMSSRVRLRIRTQRCKLAPNEAIPIGLLANELVTNAYKYAFPDALRGQIALDLRHRSDGALILRIEDDGVGMRASSDEGGLGLKLVHTFAAQLQGTITISQPVEASGTVVTLTIPRQPERTMVALA